MDKRLNRPIASQNYFASFAGLAGSATSPRNSLKRTVSRISKYGKVGFNEPTLFFLVLFCDEIIPSSQQIKTQLLSEFRACHNRYCNRWKVTSVVVADYGSRTSSITETVWRCSARLNRLANRRIIVEVLKTQLCSYWSNKKSWHLILRNFKLAGFTGQLVAEYLSASYPVGLRWAIVGRNEAKLRSLHSKLKLSDSVGILVADAEGILCCSNFTASFS